MRKTFLITVAVMVSMIGRANADRECTVDSTSGWCFFDCAAGDLIEIVSQGEQHCISGQCYLVQAFCDVATASCYSDGDCPGICTGCMATSDQTASVDSSGFCFGPPGDEQVTRCRSIGTP